MKQTEIVKIQANSETGLLSCLTLVCVSVQYIRMQNRCWAAVYLDDLCHY